MLCSLDCNKFLRKFEHVCVVQFKRVPVKYLQLLQERYYRNCLILNEANTSGVLEKSVKIKYNNKYIQSYSTADNRDVNLWEKRYDLYIVCSNAEINKWINVIIYNVRYVI